MLNLFQHLGLTTFNGILKQVQDDMVQDDRNLPPTSTSTPSERTTTKAVTPAATAEGATATATTKRRSSSSTKLPGIDPLLAKPFSKRVTADGKRKDDGRNAE